MAQPSRFWDRHAKGYAKRPVADEAAYQRKLKMTQDYLTPDMEVLEMGCGTGTTALIHAPFVKHITGIDISRNMIEIARAKAEAGNVKNVSFQKSSVDGLETSDASYDVVMGHSILHLMENKEAVIARVHRMLKPGGVFVSSTACLGGRLPMLRAILPLGRFLGLLPLVKFFTVNELEGDLTDAGFRIDHQWQPDKSKAVFIVATKADGGDVRTQAKKVST
jgi:2-polyprenyl-3-methyl-5-hydroxy-6-metoxy-1,4-benzoquinol methylase